MLYKQGRAALYDQVQAMLYKHCRHGCTNLDFTEAAYMWPGLFYKQAGPHCTNWAGSCCTNKVGTCCINWAMMYKQCRLSGHVV